MRSKTADWFEIGIRYERTNGNGEQKKITERYTVDALSFTEAEQRITEHMAAYIGGDFEIRTEQLAPYREVVFCDDETSNRWYKAKLAFITMDEHSMKEKRSNVTYLVNASSLKVAVENIDEIMAGTMIDYAIVAVSETKVVDVIEHE